MIEQEAERPKRRRRSAIWLVLIVALVVGSGWWRFRPQIDPRLVGKWSITTPTITTPYVLWDLTDDGSGAAYQYLDAARPSWRTPLSWSVDDGVVRVSESLTPMRYLGRMRELFAGLGRRSDDMVELKVVSASEDEVLCDLIDLTGTWQRWTLSRVAPDAQPPVPSKSTAPSRPTETSSTL